MKSSISRATSFAYLSEFCMATVCSIVGSGCVKTDDVKTPRTRAAGVASFRLNYKNNQAMDIADDGRCTVYKTALDEKKKLIGDNAAAISTASTEVETMEGQVADDQEFLGTLTERCATKKAAYEKRNMLRANEEAAIAEAISILNSDAAFAAFGKVDETATGRDTFVQLSSVDTRSKLIKTLSASHTARVQKIVAALKSDNPFVKVLEMINKSITLIDDEETADVQKKDWCESEQSTNNANKADKEGSMQSLEDQINTLEISIADTQSSIADATADLKENRDSQASTTKTRTEANAQFTENVKNMEEAERILAKATEVLTKYYTFLHSHNAEKSYAKKEGKDSGGGNLKRLSGKSVPELEEACSETPECVAFNTAGWLKSSLAPEEEWYAWDGGDLYIKELSLLQTRAKQPLEGEPEGEFNSGQGESGNKAIDMLTFIAGETTKSKEEAIADEQTAKEEYDREMESLTTAEKNLLQDLDGYNLALTTDQKSLDEANVDFAQTSKEHAAIVKYLAEIEPGCTFIQTNYETRKQNREGEKAALENAIDLIKATPIFQAAMAAQDKEDLGKCAPVCEEEGADHAKCLSCQEGVTVFGWCANPDNSGAPGCSEATATGSAAALE
jgi:chromosome segregation ATPase